ncbi:unnamed protein product, partial [Mesorhabditis spiculigera]
MDLPVHVQHRILENVPLKTVLKMRCLHSTFDNYFRFHCKTWNCFSLAIIRREEKAATFFQLDYVPFDQKNFRKCRLLTLDSLRITTPLNTLKEHPVDLGGFGGLVEAGGLRIPSSCGKVTISMQRNRVDLTEATRLKTIFIEGARLEKITSETTTAILDELRLGTATRQMVDGMIEELNSGDRSIPWRYVETDSRHYINHTNATFFITKRPSAGE